MVVEGKSDLIYTIADLIANARQEVLAARSVGDVKSERFWSETVDRLLEIYVEDNEV